MRVTVNCSKCRGGFFPKIETLCSSCKDKAKAINESILLQPILRAAKEHFYAPFAKLPGHQENCGLCQAVSDYLEMLNNRRGEG